LIKEFGGRESKGGDTERKKEEHGEILLRRGGRRDLAAAKWRRSFKVGLGGEMAQNRPK